MSTATATPNPTDQALTVTQPSENRTTEREDYVVGYNLATDPEGKTVRTASFMFAGTEEATALIKKATEEKKFEPLFPVTVSFPRARNLAGIKEICPDEEEAAMNFNRGAKQKGANRMKAILTKVTDDGEIEFNPEKDLTNGVLDMTAEIASPSKRKVLTEEEKLDRFLEQFPENMKNAMKSAYLAARG